MPMVIWVDTRTPDRITGHASGSRTRHSSLPRPRPMPRAASITAGSTPRRPTMVLRVIGSSAYSTSAISTFVRPSPNGPMKMPSSASDGMVRNTAVVVVASDASTGRR